MIGFSIDDEIIIGEHLILPAIDGLPVIINTIGVGVVKLVNAQSCSTARTAAAFSNFEVIGFGAVVGEGVFVAYPNLVFAAGIGGVVVATGGVDARGAIANLPSPNQA